MEQRSISGFLFSISVRAVSWLSKKQTLTASATANTEYVARASATNMFRNETDKNYKAYPIFFHVKLTKHSVYIVTNLKRYI